MVQIEESWRQALETEFEKDYFHKLTDFVRNEYRQHTCFPPGKEIFNAFNLCPIDKVKVVILGQDPYHGPGQAEGLCFSVKSGIPLPPSLINIFKEIKDDVGRIPKVITDGMGKKLYDGSLRRWAEQGVFFSMPHLQCASIWLARTRSKVGKLSPIQSYKKYRKTANTAYLSYGEDMHEAKQN